MVKYQVICTVEVLTNYASVEDFTEVEIGMFNDANEGEIEVSVESITVESVTEIEKGGD